jgi:hypothetical protein
MAANRWPGRHPAVFTGSFGTLAKPPGIGDGTVVTGPQRCFRPGAHPFPFRSSDCHVRFVASKVMGKAPGGEGMLREHRSYDADEVDAFLRQVRRRVAELKRGWKAALDRADAAEQALARGEERLTEMLGNRLVEAQRTIDAALADARLEADDLLAEAYGRADRIIVAAEAKVRPMRTEPSPSPSPTLDVTGDDPGDDFLAALGRALELDASKADCTQPQTTPTPFTAIGRGG